MKRNLVFIGLLTVSSFMYSQVGINTPTPRATLDITAKTSDGSSPEGVIFPKLTGDEIKSADAHYGADQVGTIIFATLGVSSREVGSKTENIDTPGYYYFDGVKWMKIKENSWNIEGNTGTDPNIHFMGTKDNQDLIFKRNNMRSGIISDKNTAFGYEALNPLVSGVYNTSMGVSALKSVTTGRYNTAVGSEALQSNTTGDENVSIGLGTLSSSTTGNYNTALGTFSLFSNISGLSNTAVGRFSSRLNTTGSFNTSVGVQSLESNTDGSENVAVGYVSLAANSTGQNNTALGNYALTQNSTGSDNVAVGYGALRSGKGSQNTILGTNAASNINGDGNIVIGYEAGTSSSGYVLNNRLIIANSSTITPLIDGDFSAKTLKTNGTFEINNGTRNGAIKIVDGTQDAGKVLTSDADGVGIWKSVAISFRSLSIPSITYTHPANNNNMAKYTGVPITLPPGKWLINVTLGVEFMNSAADTYSKGSNFIRFRLGDTTRDLNIGSFSSDAMLPKLASAGFGKSEERGMVRGDLGVNNTSGANKTYYLLTDNVSSTGGLVSFDVRFDWDESSITYQPIQ
ncbi:hypothetical protein [Chryseobacterium viscerum]|uniref:Trimeric autotransporter adhesin YadA-like head domain-containing protein n=1 Tax=Chryseobacterium viscerum TaxID=1037377 RepID=A0A5N4BV19_9FLAO|nr:hypothetical protein [Chryseobacterium viscerum]KAB1232262.1 hypothetical protein F8D52_00420 [Chryseobacterium viscerum]